MKLTISISDSEYALLEEKAKQDLTHASTTAATIIGCWCADRRAERRHQASPLHYSDRRGSDYEEVME